MTAMSAPFCHTSSSKGWMLGRKRRMVPSMWWVAWRRGSSPRTRRASLSSPYTGRLRERGTRWTQRGSSPLSLERSGWTGYPERHRRSLEPRTRLRWQESGRAWGSPRGSRTARGREGLTHARGSSNSSWSSWGCRRGTGGAGTRSGRWRRRRRRQQHGLGPQARCRRSLCGPWRRVRTRTAPLLRRRRHWKAWWRHWGQSSSLRPRAGRR